MTMTDERIVEFPALTDAQAKLDAKRKGLKSVLDEAGPEYDMSKVKTLSGDTSAKVAEIGKMNAEIDDAKKAVDEFLVVARAAAKAKTEDGSRVGGSEGGPSGGPEYKGSAKSVGELMVESQAVKGYKPGMGTGPMAQLGIGLKDLFERSAGWEPEVTRTGRLEAFATRPAPHVVDFLPQTTTTQMAVMYMEETVYTNAAAETGEGLAYPEAQLQVEEQTSPVRKIAVFLPVTDEQFEDEARAQGYVNNRLPFMIRQRLDLQCLVGNGTGQNLRGTANVTGIQTQALGADPLVDAIYKAATRIRDDGFAEPSSVFVRPSNWESVRLARTADGHYIWGHPSMPGPMTVWGIPVTETTAAPASSVLLGDYANYAELAVRRGIDVQVSNSHGEYFTEGKLAVRADMRAALIHYRPKAFAAVTGL